jgi:hypothetical protein
MIWDARAKTVTSLADVCGNFSLSLRVSGRAPVTVHALYYRLDIPITANWTITRSGANYLVGS